MSNALDDLRQTLADVICSDRAVDNWQAMQSDYDLADAIIAALPGLVTPQMAASQLLMAENIETIEKHCKAFKLSPPYVFAMLKAIREDSE